jgi:hypothetical protein
MAAQGNLLGGQALGRGCSSRLFAARHSNSMLQGDFPRQSRGPLSVLDSWVRFCGGTRTPFEKLEAQCLLDASIGTVHEGLGKLLAKPGVIHFPQLARAPPVAKQPTGGGVRGALAATTRNPGPPICCWPLQSSPHPLPSLQKPLHCNEHA